MDKKEKRAIFWNGVAETMRENLWICVVGAVLLGLAALIVISFNIAAVVAYGTSMLSATLVMSLADLLAGALIVAGVIAVVKLLGGFENGHLDVLEAQDQTTNDDDWE